jgi:hypothetical protein
LRVSTGMKVELPIPRERDQIVLMILDKVMPKLSGKETSGLHREGT